MFKFNINLKKWKYGGIFKLYIPDTLCCISLHNFLFTLSTFCIKGLKYPKNTFLKKSKKSKILDQALGYESVKKSQALFLCEIELNPKSQHVSSCPLQPLSRPPIPSHQVPPYRAVSARFRPSALSQSTPIGLDRVGRRKLHRVLSGENWGCFWSHILVCGKVETGNVKKCVGGKNLMWSRLWVFLHLWLVFWIV